jgi:hypothetical protein
VRPIPPLRAALAAAITLGLLGMLLPWAFGGPALRGGGAWSSATYLATLIGLAAMGIGAVAAALAAAVPGRDGALRAGALGACAGFAAALLGGLWGMSSPGTEAGLGPYAYCVLRGLVLSIAPTWLVCAYFLRGVSRRPGRGAALALAGAVALGAAAVHATCPSDSPVHWIAAHTLAPVFALVVLTAPVAGVIALRSRRAAQR